MKKVIDLAEIRKVRADGERIRYDSEIHPGIIQRLAILGYTQERIATALGISPRTIRRWIKEHEEVEYAYRLGGALADAEVAQSLFDQAVGWMDEKTGRRKGANVTAAIFWLKNRCGWRSEPVVPAADEDKRDDGKCPTPEEIAQKAKELLRLVEQRGVSVPTANDSKPGEIDEDEFSEFDA